jgi:hypothetical protein
VAGEKIRVRASRSTGELEVEGPPELVKEWWEKIWPLMGAGPMPMPQVAVGRGQPNTSTAPSATPAVFGEYYNEFRSDITDVDRVLVAGAFVQLQDEDRTFTTKAANQLLLDQNTKIGNASESVRRLIASKRAFVVSDGRFRVSTNGFEHLKTLKATS